MKRKKQRIKRLDLFIILLVLLKVILMFSFSSDYENQLFIPFVKHFLQSRDNPYHFFYEAGKQNMFPYPAVMLFVQSVSGAIAAVLHVQSDYLFNLLFKLPGFLMDLTIFYCLLHMFPNKTRYITVFYFASPIILYAVYMHGQLDLIPTGFLILSLYFLEREQKNHILLSSLMLSFALLSKLHILAAVPVLILYILKRDGLFAVVRWSVSLFFICAVGMFPFWSEGFIQTVLFNAEQSVLTKVCFDFSTVKVYIPVFAVLIIYFNTCNLNMINRSLLFGILNSVFTVFLAFCPPMPGWYVWIVPFITIFFIQVDENKYKNMFICLTMNLLYLFYFINFHFREGIVDLYFYGQDLTWMKVENETAKNLVFTLLAATLLYLVYLMYRLGITSNSLYKRRNIPFTIAIAGDSGSGKTTLVELLSRYLGSHSVLLLEGDGDHRWERGMAEWKKYTHLNPKANYLYRQAEDIEKLRTGNGVQRTEYDHDTGTFKKAKKVYSRRFIILCGLHSLYLPQMRRIADLKIYMDVDKKLRYYWKIQRDMEQRGYCLDDILQQIKKRAQDSSKYIVPQKDYADIIIHYFDQTLQDYRDNNHEIVLSLKLTLDSEINVEPLLSILAQYNINAVYDYSDDLKKQILIFDGSMLQNKTIPYHTIADQAVEQLEEITRQRIEYDNALDGIIQLFLFVLISYKLRRGITDI